MKPDIYYKSIPRSVLYAALYTFAAHYYSGQWSRGYRLLCRADKAYQRYAGITPRLEYWEAEIYRQRSMLGKDRSDLVNLYFYFVDTYGDLV